MNVKKYLQILKFLALACMLAIGLQTNVYAASDASKNIKVNGKLVAAKAMKYMKLAAVDLSRILPYVMGAGDVFQGYESVVYRNVQALRLRIFNQNSGRVRYIYVDAQTGRIL